MIIHANVSDKQKRNMKAKRFWKWFLRNKSNLEDFIQSNQENYSIYNKLTRKIQKVDTLLFPEITIDSEKRFNLIITCDGIAEGLKSVISLGDSAPVVDKWVIKKFRQPCDKMSLNFQDLKFELDDIKVWREFDLEKGKVNIVILLNNYDSNDNRFKALAFLYLDHFIGEFNTITRVGQVDFLGWDSMNDKREAVDLITLRNEISRKLY
jgi:hypothetical protein